MDLESHRCIVNMQNVTLFLCVRVYGCHATHILHSSNKHFQKQFCLTISCITSTLVCVAFYIGMRNLKQPESLKFGSLTL